jgi:hypothetical protein
VPAEKRRLVLPAVFLDEHLFIRDHRPNAVRLQLDFNPLVGRLPWGLAFCCFH